MSSQGSSSSEYSYSSQSYRDDALRRREERNDRLIASGLRAHRSFGGIRLPVSRPPQVRAPTPEVIHEEEEFDDVGGDTEPEDDDEWDCVPIPYANPGLSRSSSSDSQETVQPEEFVITLPQPEPVFEAEQYQESIGGSQYIYANSIASPASQMSETSREYLWRDNFNDSENDSQPTPDELWALEMRRQMQREMSPRTPIMPMSNEDYRAQNTETFDFALTPTPISNITFSQKVYNARVVEVSETKRPVYNSHYTPKIRPSFQPLVTKSLARSATAHF
ncbi:hypothetical protein QCA50_006216 [Cerrena zonata]|uniref:Uncharacterized protein n=1 Tax=Cerrena zonata TaxID=2478898 RepID=A0AAW0GLN4_9APHY